MTSETIRKIRSQILLKGVEISIVLTWNKAFWHSRVIGQISGNSFLPLKCREFIICLKIFKKGIKCINSLPVQKRRQTISSGGTRTHVSAEEPSIAPSSCAPAQVVPVLVLSRLIGRCLPLQKFSLCMAVP
ncbi:hypothetical protein HJG60_011149 [Phyllostomus discolor]|uniref:Uncharacterized protein n=1 Tax=Phyllostomus discolor TaxID=89673 RepID=A0A834A3X9_9CHIR|nr:hypothetical protein HJG60_011149 [Phyllostomus discolor]